MQKTQNHKNRQTPSDLLTPQTSYYQSMRPQRLAGVTVTCVGPKRFTFSHQHLSSRQQEDKQEAVTDRKCEQGGVGSYLDMVSARL